MAARRDPAEAKRLRALGIRPPWHRVVGWMLVVLALYVVVGNDFMLFVGTPLLPGGHSELWLIAGVATAAASIWWFGWMDRPAGK